MSSGMNFEMMNYIIDHQNDDNYTEIDAAFSSIYEENEINLETELMNALSEDRDNLICMNLNIPTTRIRDPSDPNASLFEKKANTSKDGEVVKTDRRNENHKSSTRILLSSSDRKRFSSDMYVNKMSLPIVTINEEDRLDLSKISDEISRDFRGLSTIVVTRATLASAVSFGFYEAFGTRFTDDISDIQRNAMINQLVGHIIPIFGQSRAPPVTGFGPKSKIYANHTPLCDGHTFGYEPVVISTKGDGPGDSGEIICQGIIVSNKGLNFQVDDARRVSLGRRDEFEETMCWVLITHVYSFIPYDALGPNPTTKTKDGYKYIPTAGKNKFNDIFMWNEFMEINGDQLGCGVSRFGFSDTKQTGKDISRRLFPWSIREAMSTLEWLRSKDLKKFLLETPMSLGRRQKDREECPSGMDIRRFLLGEMLFKNTPLENLIRNERVLFPFESPLVADGGYGLYSRLTDYMILNNIK